MPLTLQDKLQALAGREDVLKALEYGRNCFYSGAFLDAESCWKKIYSDEALGEGKAYAAWGLAKIRTLENDFLKAEKLCKEASDLFLASENKSMLNMVYLQLGEINFSKKFFKEALYWFEKVDVSALLFPSILYSWLILVYLNISKKEEISTFLKLLEEEGEIEGLDLDEQVNLLQFYYNLGVIWDSLSNIGKAVQYLQKGLELARKTSNITFIIKFLILLSEQMFSQFRFKESRGLLAEAQAVIDKLNYVPTSLYHQLLWAQIRVRNLSEADWYLYLQEKKATLEDIPYTKVENLFLRAAILKLRGEWKDVKKIYQDLLQYGEKLNDPRLKAIGLLGLGKQEEIEGRFWEGRKLIEEAKEIFGILQHFNGVADALEELALMESSFEDGEGLLKEALTLRKEKGTSWSYWEGLCEAARFYIIKSLPKEAMEYIEEARLVAEELSSVARFYTHIHLADFYMNTNNLKALLELLKETEEQLKLFKEEKFYEGEEILLLLWGDYYLAIGEVGKALNQYLSLLSSIEESSIKVKLNNVYGKIAQVYEYLGEWDKALYYYEKKKEIEEKLGASSILPATYEALKRIYDQKIVSTTQAIAPQRPQPISLKELLKLIEVRPLSLELSTVLYQGLSGILSEGILSWFNQIRRGMAMELGLILPPVYLEINPNLKEGSYVIKIRELKVAEGILYEGRFLIVAPERILAQFEGISTSEPTFGLPAKWIDEKGKAKALEMGCMVFDPFFVFTTHIMQVLRNYSGDLLGKQEVSWLLENLRKTHPALVEEVYPRPFGLVDIQKVLKNLLKERVSIKDLVLILETMGDYSHITQDPDVLTEYVRQRLGKLIIRDYISEQGELRAILLGKELEDILSQAIRRTEFGSFLILSHEQKEEVIQKITPLITKALALGAPPVIICTQTVRRHLKQFTEKLFPALTVLSFNEIPMEVKLIEI